jgi:hypothetical protein
MKKIYLSFLFITAALISNAQSLSQANHAPVVGETYTTTGASTVAPGPSGTGVSWNFSSITTTTPTMNYSVVTAASTSSASSYPNASLALQTGTNNTFYSSSPTELKFWGGILNIGGYNIEVKYTSPAIVASYPMAFNTTTNSSVAGSVSAFGFNGTFTGNANVILDGIGTLDLPSRTFTNVLRVATTQTLNYTIPFAGSGVVTLETYDYYGTGYPNTKYALYSLSNATLTFGSTINSSQSLATLRTDYLTIGIKENTKSISNVKLFPNPAEGAFTLSFNNENGTNSSYELINALGQSVRKGSIGSEKGLVKYVVELDGIDPGIYFVKLISGNSSSVQKITVQ